MVGFDLNLQVVTVQRLWNILSLGWSCFSSPSSSPPPTRQNDIYRVPCSGLWPWKPSLLLSAHPTLPAPQHVSQIVENVGMESPHGRAERLTDLCAWSALTQNMEMWAASWVYTSDLWKHVCKLFYFCCVLLCYGLFFAVLFNRNTDSLHKVYLRFDDPDTNL